MRYTKKVVGAASTVTVCLCIATIFCILLSDQNIQSELATFNLKEWIKRISTRRKTFHGTGYMCTADGGRLGNHMYHYASLLGIAKHGGFEFFLPENNKLEKYFNIEQEKTVLDNHACEHFPVVQERKGCCTYDDTLMSLEKGGNYIIGDWLQSWKYFKDYFEEVRREFTFQYEIRVSAEYIVENLRKSHLGNVTMVGIHLRVGDITRHNSLLERGFRNAPDSYVHRAVDLIQGIYHDVIFIVCSNEIDKAREILRNKITEVFYFSISPAHDMAILSKCDHVIMTVGTFGWWAGFLSNGTVIYYKYPYRNDSEIWKQFDYEDYYLPEWIGLD